MKKKFVLITMVATIMCFVVGCNSTITESKPVSAEDFKTVMEKDGYVVEDMTENETERPDYLIRCYSASNENKTVADFHMYIREYENSTEAQTVYDSLINKYTDWEYFDNLTITQYDDGVRQMYKETTEPAYYIAVLNNDTIMIVNSVDTEKETVDKYFKQFNFYVNETTAENISPEKPRIIRQID